MAWNLSGFFSANLYPFPFLVKTWIKTGPFTCLLVFSMLSNFSILCPSTGPRYVNPMSSKNILCITNCFMALFILWIPTTIGLPMTGTELICFFNKLFVVVYNFFVLNFPKNLFNPPTLGDMLISLSFKITVILHLL